MAVEIIRGSTEPIGVVYYANDALVTGASLSVTLRRTSDGYGYNFSTNTFVNGAGTSQALTESPSGTYEFSWNTSLITNAVSAGTAESYTYVITDSTNSRIVDGDEIRVRAIDTIATNATTAVSQTTSTAIAADVLDAALSGHTTSGTLGGRMDAAVSTRAAPGDLMGLSSNAITSAKIASGAITSAAFGSGAIDATAFAQGAADKVWSSTSRTLSSGAITSSTFGAGALGAVWDEATSGHTTSGTYGLLVATNLDTTVSSRSTLTASGVWSTAVPGAFSSGAAGYILGTYLDAAVSTRLPTSSYSAPPSASTIAVAVVDQTLSGHTTSGTAGAALAHLDADITSRAAPGDAMALTSGERSTVQALILSDATPFQGARIDAAISSRSTLTASGVWSTSLPGSFTSGQAGNIVGTNLDATVSSRLPTASYSAPPSASTVAAAVVDQALSGHTTAGSVGEALSFVDVAVSTRLASASYTAPPTTSAIATQVWQTSVPGAFTSGQAGYVLGNGSSPSAIASAVWATTVPGSFTSGQAGYVLGNGGGSGPTVQQIVDGVLNEALSLHTTTGSVGGVLGTNLDATISSRLATSSYTAPLSSSQTASAVWGALTASYASAGTFGALLGTNLDTTVSSRAATGAQMALTAGAISAVQSGIATSTALATAQADLTAIKGASFTTGDDLHSLKTAISALPSAASISTQVASDLATAHGAGSWATADVSALATSAGLSSTQTTLSTAISGVPAAVAALDVSSASNALTIGGAITLIRRFTTWTNSTQNAKVYNGSTHKIDVYNDAGNAVLYSVPVHDATGGNVSPVAGDPWKVGA